MDYVSTYHFVHEVTAMWAHVYICVFFHALRRHTKIHSLRQTRARTYTHTDIKRRVVKSGLNPHDPGYGQAVGFC